MLWLSVRLRLWVRVRVVRALSAPAQRLVSCDQAASARFDQLDPSGSDLAVESRATNALRLAKTIYRIKVFLHGVLRSRLEKAAPLYANAASPDVDPVMAGSEVKGFAPLTCGAQAKLVMRRKASVLVLLAALQLLL